MKKTYAISSIYDQIKAEIGNFTLVSMNAFEAHGETRTRYTVRKPKGKKLIHFIGFPNGAVRKIDLR